MNFYKRYMGDYAKKTARLTLAQHGAYTLLLDEIYVTEQPLPAQHDELYRVCRAMNKAEQEAVRVVADRFFPVGPDGLRHNPRATQELKEAAPAMEAARLNGKKGGRPKKRTQQKPTGFSESNPGDTQGEPGSKPPHSSDTSSSLRSEDVAQALALDAIPAKLLADYRKVRSAKRAGVITDTVMAGLQREADKAGLTLEQAVTACCEFGWQGFNADWYASRTAGRAKPANTHKYAAASAAIFEDDDERRTVNA